MAATGALNNWCQKFGLKPEWTWCNAPAMGGANATWIGTLRIPGVEHESTFPGQNKKAAIESCTNDFVEYLSKNGLFEQAPGAVKALAQARGDPTVANDWAHPQGPTTKKPRLLDPNALAPDPPEHGGMSPHINGKGGSGGGSWGSWGAGKNATGWGYDAWGGYGAESSGELTEISASGFVQPGATNATPAQLFQQRMALRQTFMAMTGQQPQTGKKKNQSVDAKYQQILTLVRQAQPQAAFEVVASMVGMAGGLSLKQYSTIVAAVSCRADAATSVALFEALEERQVVAFPDTDCMEHFYRFSKWIVMDLIADGEACLTRAKTVPGPILEAGGHCVTHLRAQRTKSGTELQLTGNIPYQTSFQKGDWIFITASVEEGEPTVGLDGTIEAEVQTMFGKGITVKVVGHNDADITPIIDRWVRVDKAGNRITYNRQIDALRQACTMAPEMQWLRTAIFDKRQNLDQFGDIDMEKQAAAQLRGNAQSASLLSQMNDSQQRAVTAALVRRMTTIQGPPGTGKTYTAAMLIQLLVLSGHTPILACADSNIAVDNLLSALGQTQVRAVRIGRPESTRPDLERFNIESQFKGMPGAFTGFAPTKGREWGELTRFIKMAQVVCATCSGAATPSVAGVEFKAIVIDEATQATEPSSLIPLARTLPESAIILVGDHCQLPPTVLSQEASEQGYGVSFFERLATRGMTPLLLDTQYRMHPAIAAFPSMQFYDSRLRSGIPGSLRSAPKSLSWRDRRVPISVIPVHGQDTSEGTSFVNTVEAQMVRQLCCHILTSSNELAAKDIGIISPYAAQVRRIKRDLGAASPQARTIEVNSVDGFQGREKELIIVSTVRANAAGNIGFLSDPRRLNVAITRAKRGLVVLGDLKTLASDQGCWGPWLKWAQECGLIQGSTPLDRLAAAELARLDELAAEELVKETGPASKAKFA